MQITRFLHAAIPVSNLEQSDHFYGTVLGLPKRDRTLTFSGTWYEIDGIQVHLIEVPTVIGDAQNAEKWGRNRHLAFSVADIDTTKEQLMAHGCEFQMSNSGRAALFVKDPDGHVIELGAIA
ncbi:glyoxalase [Myxacorys almedinensis A]|uniref:Glyoxalase n=2 Tax=Myxacorys TaxID=2056239 RepID=A0A8J7Z6H5_9CYAN|nr:glyoxalase [Myxacorys almedinensis A]